MADIYRNQVIDVRPCDLPVCGLIRVIWMAPQKGAVMVIAVDQIKRSGPQQLPLHALRAALDDGHAVQASPKPDPRSLMSDEQLAKTFPPKRAGEPSYPIAYRNHWWAIIDPILHETERYFLGQLSLNQLVNQRANETGASRQRIYQVLYRYWAAGSSRAALLPDSAHCGGRGAKRAGYKRTLGRRTLESAINGRPSNNFPLANKDIEHIQSGWRLYLKAGVSVRDAYEKTLRTFYIAEWQQSGSETRHILQPPENRPSFRQFRYHGPRQNEGQQAWRIHLDPRDYLLNHRPLDGLPNSGLGRIGAVAQADASTNDVHLVSVFDRSRIVGTCHHVLIVDEFTGLIVGFSVAWSVDAQAAMLALLNAASSKVDLCARYGITISDEQWPRAVFGKVLIDRGEFNCEAVYEAFRLLNCSLELAQTGRGDAKGLVEGKHHSLHASVSHKLPGTTLGKMRGRGKREPALDACLDIHEYTGELVRAIIFHNTAAPVPHQLSTEMLRDRIAPTRIAIWNWAAGRGYAAYTNCDSDRLITTLCPITKAVVDLDGVHLLTRRPPPANDEVLVMRLRYLGEIATQRGWLETARRRGKLRISVYYNPYDLRRVWFLDPESGLQALDLVTNDTLLSERATLDDLLQAQTHLSLATHRQGDVATQSRSNMAMARETTIHNAIAATTAAHAMADKPPSKRARLAERRQNRHFEILQTGKLSVPPMQGIAPASRDPASQESQTERVSSSIPARISHNDIEDWLTEGEPK